MRSAGARPRRRRRRPRRPCWRCYFAGLGARRGGGARRPRARPCARYALLELGAAAGALWSLARVPRCCAATRAQRVARRAGGPSARIAAVAVAILPATLCLGATLPALGAGAGRRGARRPARRRCSTRSTPLGGAVGIAAAGFGLPALIGVRGELRRVAAATSALAGVAARSRSRRAMPHRDVAARRRQSRTALGRAALARAAARRRRRRRARSALGLEVLWTRLFAQVLHNSVYSFTAVALVFVLALALGRGARGARCCAACAPRGGRRRGAARRRRSRPSAGFWVFVALDRRARLRRHAAGPRRVPAAHRRARRGRPPVRRRSPPASCCRRCGRRGAARDGAARPLGDLSAANTLGGIAGALAAGFVASAAARPARRASSPPPSATSSSPTSSRRGAARCGRSRTRRCSRSSSPTRCARRSCTCDPRARRCAPLPRGRAASSRVVETDGDLQLRLDNYYVLGGSAAATNERRLGLLPLLLHPRSAARRLHRPRDRHHARAPGPALGVDETTVVELVPEVAAAARAHFARWNGGLLERPDVRLVLDDGRRYLAAHAASASTSIVSDLFIPWHAGAGSLYAREMYETVARAPRAGRPLLPVAAALPADARGVRRHRAHVPRRLPARERCGATTSIPTGRWSGWSASSEPRAVDLERVARAARARCPRGAAIRCSPRRAGW